jgi:N-acetylglutamate synthase-like GNAT family acetyltransferase
MNLSLAEAVDPSDIAAVRELLVEYAGALGVDLCFQQFDEELANLPGKYAPPHGRLLLARANDAAVGCVALRPLAESGICEMKRLFVRPAYRSFGVGRRLVEAIIAAAKELGYREMWLDTLPQMTSARRLYRELGFRPVEAYCHNPVAGTDYLALQLE